jgi:Aspartate oxidase
MRELEYDFVVIGSGLAGLVAAWHAAGYGKVALISKSQLDISNSYNAQGGVAAAMGSDDAPALHFDDTLTAGRGLCDHDAVEILVNEGVDCVKQMIDSGIHFDCDPTEKLFLDWKEATAVVVSYMPMAMQPAA